MDLIKLFLVYEWDIVRGNTLIKKEKELSNMARIRKEYKMTEKNVEYIEEVKVKIIENWWNKSKV